MWIADHWKDYAVLDCGGGERIERWGNQILQRPDPQASRPRNGKGSTPFITAAIPAAAAGRYSRCPRAGRSNIRIWPLI